jgi:hypothetical protein
VLSPLVVSAEEEVVVDESSPHPATRRARQAAMIKSGRCIGGILTGWCRS